MQHRTPLFAGVIAAVCLGNYAMAQTSAFATPRVRITRAIDESTTISLPGNVHPLIASATLSKPADAGTLMDNMILYLKGDPTQEAELAELIAEQHDPKSPLYHEFLTPQSFGSQFGVAQPDIAKVRSWLESHGFTVEGASAGNRSIVFSGNASQVASAFKTEIRSYVINGVTHIANASDPQIPAALSGIVGGVVKLHDFRHSANMSSAKPVSSAELAHPNFNYGASHYLSPGDYTTIYDLAPLYSAGINGSGESIAIIARSNIYMSDMTTFRSQMGLPANNPVIVLTSSDPGVVQGDSVETTLDTEWSGAVAPNASLKVIVAASTASADGIDLSALYAVTHNVAPVVSLSYGSCEASMGSSELAFYNSLWQQAAAQGQSVLVSSGDSGAAGCYGGSSSSGSGRAVNGLCTSPYSTCVGGTEFADATNPGQYWLPGNNSAYGSATGYIPEAVWNESGNVSGGSGLWAGGGGASITYAKPAWQTGPGVPADGKRDVPDVALAAAGHDGYLIWLSGGLNAVGGTSAAAPSFAGMMALVDQKAGRAQGLANAILYPLAITQAAGGAKVFHDITGGNNSVPGVTGFSATTGYDLASGLGSVDANLLVNNWASGTTPVAALTLSASSATLTLLDGKTAQVTITSTAASTLKSAVALAVTGAPSGLTATLASSSIASPGSGTVILNVAASATLAQGTYNLTVTGSGGGKTTQANVAITVPTPTFALASSSTSLAVVAGGSVPVNLSTTPQNGYSTAVAMTISGLPTGVTAAFLPATVPAAGGISVLTLTSAKTTAAGTYSLTITAKGGTVTQTATIPLVVSVPASCTLATSQTSLSMNAGAVPAILQVTCGTPKGTFSGPLALTLAGAPAGLTATLGANTLTPGSTTTLTVAPALTMASKSSTLTLTATGSGFTEAITLPVTIAAVNSFSLSAAQSTVTAQAGTATRVTVTSTLVNSYNGSVNFSVSGLPTGVTAAFSKSSLAAPGSGSTVVTLSAGSTAAAGTYNTAIVGTGTGGIVESTPVALTVAPTQNFQLVVNTTTLTIAQGGRTNVTYSIGNYSGGFNSQINITFSGLAPGMNWGTVSAVPANNMINWTMAFSAATYTPMGTYPVTITATGGGITHSVVVSMTVTAPATSSKH